MANTTSSENSEEKMPLEVYGRIIALTMPFGIPIAPCKAKSKLAAAKILKRCTQWPHVSSADGDIVFHIIVNAVVCEDNRYNYVKAELKACTHLYDKAELQAYTNLLLISRGLREYLLSEFHHEPGFYKNNTFVFPNCDFLRLFISSLSEYRLSLLRTVSISFLLDEHLRFFGGGDIRADRGQSLWSKLSCLRKCDKLKQVHILLKMRDCGMQALVFDHFQHHGRKSIGMVPKINVAIISCRKCKDPEKSLHLRGESLSGSEDWKVTYFLGANPVQSLSQTLAENPIGDDPASRDSSIAKLREIGANLKLNRCCHTCGGYLVGMPDDLRLSRGFWCKYCELIVYCKAHAGNSTTQGSIIWGLGIQPDLPNFGHTDSYCVPKPHVETPEQRQARWDREDLAAQ